MASRRHLAGFQNSREISAKGPHHHVSALPRQTFERHESGINSVFTSCISERVVYTIQQSTFARIISFNIGCKVVKKKSAAIIFFLFRPWLENPIMRSIYSSIHFSSIVPFDPEFISFVALSFRFFETRCVPLFFLRVDMR